MFLRAPAEESRMLEHSATENCDGASWRSLSIMIVFINVVIIIVIIVVCCCYC